MFDIETHVAHWYHMSTMSPREYIDAHVINVWLLSSVTWKEKEVKALQEGFLHQLMQW